MKHPKFISKRIKEWLLIIAGSCILAISVGLFVLPNNILTGGVAGIVVIIKKFFPVNEEYLVIVINVVLFIVGWIFLGKKFFRKTILSLVSYSIALLIVKEVFVAPQVNPILAAVYGGMLSGIGVAMVIKQGGSTGGMDIPPLILQKYFDVDPSKGIMVTDALTVLAGFYAYGFEAILLGLVSVFVSGTAINKILNAYKGITGTQIQIISDKYEDISNAIMTELERGTTIINGKGGYSNDEKHIILVVVSDNELDDVMNIINRYDKNAFTITSEAIDVNGEGFTYTVRI